MKKIKLSDVALEAGVSTATVSRVINNTGYVSADVKDAVMSAIKRTGYKLAEAPSEPSKTNLVGVILKKLPNNMFFESLSYAFLRELEKNGMYAVTIFCEHINNDTIKIYAEKLLDYNVRGIIISGMEEPSIRPDIRTLLLKSNIPVVFVERLADSQGFNQVCVNNILGGYMAARHLIKRGHKKILYIGRGGYLDSDFGSRRINGFLKAMQEEPNPPEYLIKICNTPHPSEAYRVLKEAENEFPGFTAVQAWYDGYLIGALQYLNEKNLRTPEDVELIGQDDTYSSILVPKISSVHMPFEEMARVAAEIICDWQNQSKEHFVKTVNLEPKLIIRGIPEA